jgi:hypothetical protein
MRRALALGVALLALVAAGFLWTRDRPVALASAPPPAAEDSDGEAPEPAMGLVAPQSNVTPAMREARRFGRVDKDRDARISRDEYLANRKKAFARLDRNGDGRLGFDEYSASTTEKFARADRNGDGALVAPEFATTAAKRKPKAACACPPAGG